MARYEFSEGNSSKFWEIVLNEDDASFTVRWGKIGTTGQEITKDFSTEDEALKEHNKLVVEKVRKGYKLVADAEEKPLVTRDPNRKTLTINLGIYVRNCGDGSATVSFFRNSDDAEQSAEEDDERLCEDTYDRTIEVYADTGELVMDDAEREAASDRAWEKRCKLETAMKKERDPGKKRKIKLAFEAADAEWEAFN